MPPPRPAWPRPSSRWSAPPGAWSGTRIRVRHKGPRDTRFAMRRARSMVPGRRGRGCVRILRRARLLLIEEVLEYLDAALGALGDHGRGVDRHDLLPVVDRLPIDLGVGERDPHVVDRLLVPGIDLQRLPIEGGSLGNPPHSVL